jgi:hypothetical protein
MTTKPYTREKDVGKALMGFQLLSSGFLQQTGEPACMQEHLPQVPGRGAGAAGART